MEADRHFNKLIEKTNQVWLKTQEFCDIESLYKYLIGYNTLLRYKPVPARPIWDTAIFESSVLQESSTFLATHGLYEEACIILRTLIDGFLTRLYWDTKHMKDELKKHEISGKRIDEYQEWELGFTNSYPTKTKILNMLFMVCHIKNYNSKYHLRDEVDNIISMLNKFVHNRPETRHPSDVGRSSLMNFAFSEKKFIEWFDYTKSVFRYVSTLSILQYPKLLETRFGYEFEILEPVQSSNIKKVLKSASGHDSV